MASLAAFHLRRAQLLRLLVLGVVLGLAAGWLAWRVLRHEALVQHMLHPQRKPVPAAALTLARQRLPELQPVVFRSPDGLALQGWYQPSRNRAAVLLVHGAGENRLWWLDEAEALARRGFGVLLYDSRAHGESEGTLQSWGDHEQLDVIGALDFLSARPDVDPARLGAEGFSVGASAVALAAARDARVRAVVLKAVWTSLDEELAHMAGPGWHQAWLVHDFRAAGVRLDQVRPRERVAAIAPRALMVVVGTRDHHVPVSVARAVYEAAGEPRRWREIEGADHVDYERLGGDGLRAEVGAFFAAALGVAAP